MLETREEYRAQAGSALLGRLETLLSQTRCRCHLMRVKTPGQAAAILRSGAGSRAPDLVLIRSARGDGRASELCGLIRDDVGLRATAFVLIAEEGLPSPEGEAAGFPELKLRARLGDPAFWWAVVSFS